ncbi:MAG: hypothetical protein Q9165_008788 [Trypethelium subeluteriae]
MPPSRTPKVNTERANSSVSTPYTPLRSSNRQRGQAPEYSGLNTTSRKGRNSHKSGLPRLDSPPQTATAGPAGRATMPDTNDIPQIPTPPPDVDSGSTEPHAGREGKAREPRNEQRPAPSDPPSDATQGSGTEQERSAQPESFNNQGQESEATAGNEGATSGGHSSGNGGPTTDPDTTMPNASEIPQNGGGTASTSDSPETGGSQTTSSGNEGSSTGHGPAMPDAPEVSQSNGSDTAPTSDNPENGGSQTTSSGNEGSSTGHGPAIPNPPEVSQSNGSDTAPTSDSPETGGSQTTSSGNEGSSTGHDTAMPDAPEVPQNNGGDTVPTSTLTPGDEPGTFRIGGVSLEGPIQGWIEEGQVRKNIKWVFRLGLKPWVILHHVKESSGTNVNIYEMVAEKDLPSGYRGIVSKRDLEDQNRLPRRDPNDYEVQDLTDNFVGVAFERRHPLVSYSNGNYEIYFGKCRKRSGQSNESQPQRELVAFFKTPYLQGMKKELGHSYESNMKRYVEQYCNRAGQEFPCRGLVKQRRARVTRVLGQQEQERQEQERHEQDRREQERQEQDRREQDQRDQGRQEQEIQELDLDLLIQRRQRQQERERARQREEEQERRQEQREQERERQKEQERREDEEHRVHDLVDLSK